MYEILLTAMLVLSIITIIAIALQPTKTQNASNAFMGGSDELFGQQKAFLIKVTIVCLILFFGIAFVLSKLS